MDDFLPFFYSFGGAGLFGILLTGLFGGINERSARGELHQPSQAPLHPDIVTKAWGSATGAAATVGIIALLPLFGIYGISSVTIGAAVGYLAGMMFRAVASMPERH